MDGHRLIIIIALAGIAIHQWRCDILKYFKDIELIVAYGNTLTNPAQKKP